MLLSASAILRPGAWSLLSHFPRCQYTGHSHPPLRHSYLCSIFLLLGLCRIPQEAIADEYIMICRDLAMTPNLCSLGEIYSLWHCNAGHFAEGKSKPILTFTIWNILEKTESQPITNLSGMNFYIPDPHEDQRAEEVNMCLCLQKSPSLAIQPIILIAATNLLCRALC